MTPSRTRAQSARPRLWCCGLVALVVSFGSLPVAAAPILDQQQLLIDLTVDRLAVGGQSDQRLAQVVTAGLSGFLTEVRFPIVGFGQLTVELRGVTGGIPNGIVLASETFAANFPLSFPPAFNGLAFSNPVFFASGDLFAVVLRSAGLFNVFQGPIGNPYPGGQAFFDALPNPPGVWVSLGDRMDLPFQTVVEPEAVPEPTVLALLVVAVGTGAVKCCRMKETARKSRRGTRELGRTL